MRSRVESGIRVNGILKPVIGQWISRRGIEKAGNTPIRDLAGDGGRDTAPLPILV
jgi:hypothetical protein